MKKQYFTVASPLRILVDIQRQQHDGEDDMAAATYFGKDQDLPNKNGSTTYWFEILGVDSKAGVDFGNGHDEFEGELFGICECGSEVTVLGDDGGAMENTDRLAIAVTNNAKVTAEMRAE